MMSVNKQQQEQQLLQQKYGNNKDGLFIRWTLCMTSSFIGVCCICILWLHYWLPAYEYRTCLADGLHEGLIDAATYAEYWLPKTITPCAAGGEILRESYIQQMGLLPVSDQYVFIDLNRRFIQPMHDKQQSNMPPGNRYAAWCQSITLNECDPYYLHLIYTALICFTCTICCLYSILTFNIYKDDDNNNNSFLPSNFKFRPICRKFRICSKRKNNFTSKLEVIREVEEPFEIDF